MLQSLHKTTMGLCAAVACAIAPLYSQPIAAALPTGYSLEMSPLNPQPMADLALDLFSPEFSCKTIISSNRATFYMDTLYLSYYAADKADSACTNGDKKYGPHFFAIAPADAGVYPVVVFRMACDSSDCAGDPVISSQGTIQIGGTASVFSQEAPEKAIRVSYRNGKLSLTLPSGSRGTWNVSLVTLKGETVKSEDIEAHGKAPIILGWSQKVNKGVYLLRLKGPMKQEHSMRIEIGT